MEGIYAITMTAAAARPARAREPALALAAPVKVATAGATAVLDGQSVYCIHTVSKRKIRDLPAVCTPGSAGAGGLSRGDGRVGDGGGPASWCNNRGGAGGEGADPVGPDTAAAAGADVAGGLGGGRGGDGGPVTPCTSAGGRGGGGLGHWLGGGGGLDGGGRAGGPVVPVASGGCLIRTVRDSRFAGGDSYVNSVGDCERCSCNSKDAGSDECGTHFDRFGLVDGFEITGRMSKARLISYVENECNWSKTGAFALLQRVTGSWTSIVGWREEKSRFMGHVCDT